MVIYHVLMVSAERIRCVEKDSGHISIDIELTFFIMYEDNDLFKMFRKALILFQIYCDMINELSLDNCARVIYFW